MTSLLDLQEKGGRQRISSPRSLEAMARQGMVSADLWPKNPQEVKDYYALPEATSQELQQFSEHFEQRRQDKIKMLVEEREKVIALGDEVPLTCSLQGWVGESSNMSQLMHRSSTCLAMSKSTVVANDRQTLVRLQQNQQKHLQTRLQHEVVLDENDRHNQNKMLKQQQKDLQIKLKRAQQKQEQEERIKEHDQFLRSKVEAERNIQHEKYLYYKERDIRLKEKEELNLQKRELSKQQKKRQLQIQSQKKQLQLRESILHQNQEIERKIQNKMLKEEQRIKSMEVKQEELRVECERAKQAQEERVRKLMEKNQTQLELRDEKNEQKAMAEESRKERFQREQQRKMALVKERGHDKQATIEQVLQNSSSLLAKRTHNYIQKQQQQHLKFTQHKAMLSQETQRRAQQNSTRKEDMLQSVLHRNRQNETHKKSSSQQVLNQKDIKTQRQSQQNRKEHSMRLNQELIKQRERKENVQRMWRIQEYHKAQLNHRIAQQYGRLHEIQQERKALHQDKLRMRRSEENSRAIIDHNVELMKQGKLTKQELFKAAGVEPMDRSVVQVPLKRSSRFNSQGSSSHANKPEGVIRNRSISEKPSMSNSEIKAWQIVEKAKERQNQEMLVLLAEEQQKDELREQQLAGLAADQNSDGLEQRHGRERARAQHVINSLSEKHEKEIKTLLKRYRLQAT